MEIQIICPACSQYLLIDESGKGQRINCPSCNQTFTVPEVSLVDSNFNPKNHPSNPVHSGFPARRDSRFLIPAILILCLVCSALVATVVILIRNRPAPSNPNSIQALSPTERQAEDVSLEGEVFVVTVGGENIKLGLVSVVVIPLPEVASYVASMRESSIHSIIQSRRDIANAKAEFERQVDSAKEAKRRQRPLDEKQLNSVEDQIIKHHEKLSEAVTGDKNQVKYLKWTDDLRVLEKRRDDLRHNLHGEFFLPANASEQQIKIQAMELRLGFSYSGDWWFSKLPSGICSTKTDSDGKFKIQVPHSGDFVIAASDSREVGNKTEDYHWLVRIETPLDSSSKIMLSNHNQFSLDDKKLFNGTSASLLSEP